MMIGFNGDQLMNQAHPNAPTVPLSLFFLYQLMFAAITPALITGGMAERLKFSTWLVFVSLWMTLVYCPIVHMFWAEDGWLRVWGVVDWAGGNCVHITSGATALVFSLFMQKRKGANTIFTWLYDKIFAKKKEIVVHWGDVKTPVINHSIPQMLLGTCFIWFGWFGFNGGSSFGANNGACIAFINSVMASCSGGITWMIVDYIFRGKPKITGACEGIIAGLIVITPMAGVVEPGIAVACGIIISLVCPLVISLKSYVIDDTLDAVGLHLTGGVIGSLLTGFFVSRKLSWFGTSTVISGGWVDANWIQLGIQLTGVVVAFGWTFSVSFVLFWLLRPLGWNVGKYEERVGLDASQHDEQGYFYEPPEKMELNDGEKKEFSIHEWIRGKVLKQKPEQSNSPMNDINVNE